MIMRFAPTALGKGVTYETTSNAFVAPARRKSIQQETLLTLAPRRLSSASNPVKLPKFPLPKLDDTLDKYLRSVQPLLPLEKFQKSKKIVEEFSNGPGIQLQKLLKEKADTSDNWLASWWTEVAYLSYRQPVVLFSSPGLYFPTRFFDNEFQWCRYAARSIWATLRYKQMIDHNEIPLETAGKYPLDMSQYKKIFGTCRIPAHNVDKLSYHPRSRHITVAHRNSFYKVNVYEKSSGKFLSENQLTEQLLSIIKNINNEPVPIGILTSEHRDTLAPAFEALCKEPVNRQSVQEIIESLFVVCLDQPVKIINPDDDYNVASHQLIHGGGSKLNSGNRWFDKTLQIVVNRNGINGFTYEHSPAEGQPIAVLADFILKHV